MPSKSSESLWVSTNHRVCIWLSVATTVPKHRWQRWWNQAIKKALNPSALASLEHLHDAWQRSEQAEGVEYDAGGFSAIASLGWWSHDDIVPYQVQRKCDLPNFRSKYEATTGLTADLRRRRSGTVHCCRTAPCLSPMMCNVFAYKLQWQLGSAGIWGLEELTGRWFQAGSSIVPSGYLT